MDSRLNPVLEVINCHVSVRKYRPDPVSREMIEMIMAAAERINFLQPAALDRSRRARTRSDGPGWRTCAAARNTLRRPRSSLPGVLI